MFRYGGEEFAVLLAGLDQQDAHDVFERFRELVASTVFPQIGQITVSIGYTSIDAQANPTVVFGKADEALYYAKENGRNRVECYQQLLFEKLIEGDKGKEDIELF
jgi:diguanylate cyclase (GGDEF)-like protein